jgi:hypothetical protein
MQVKKFAELGFHDREHLQEWLANEPTALGEELLIIQKEFDGFDETNERLDLLAPWRRRAKRPRLHAAAEPTAQKPANRGVRAKRGRAGSGKREENRRA